MRKRIRPRIKLSEKIGRKIKRRSSLKRTTLKRLLLWALIAVTAVTAVFAVRFRSYINSEIDRQAEEQIARRLSDIQRYINKRADEGRRELLMQDISVYLALYTNYVIDIREPILGRDKGSAQVVSHRSEGAYAVAALVDRNNGIAASNRRTLYSLFVPSDNRDEGGYYVCDESAFALPQMQELIQTYDEMLQNAGRDSFPEIKLTSAYIDRRTRSFIPRTGTVSLFTMGEEYDTAPEVKMSYSGTKDISITIDDSRFEVIEQRLVEEPGMSYETIVLTDLYGEKDEIISRFSSELRDTADGYGMLSSFDGGGYVYGSSIPVYIDGEQYMLCLRFVVDHDDADVTRLYYKWVVLFAAASVLIALLICWYRNVKNKLKYEFEDYQRALTDQLAHDIKTPLMAVSGYAENLRDSRLTETEQMQYLDSILDNTAFIDRLVSRTLYLNHMIEVYEPKPESVSVSEVVKKALEKYSLLLSEKHMICEVSGDAELRTDKTALTTVTENLISNTVKYTPENGRISVTVDKDRLTVTNTVTDKIDTDELKRPFVRGDKARSNTRGHGLGLAIADRAAGLNGMSLELSCTCDQFRAALIFK